MTSITLGIAAPGGGFPLYGDTMIESVREADPSLIHPAVLRYLREIGLVH